jgi:hypothetical protein
VIAPQPLSPWFCSLLLESHHRLVGKELGAAQLSSAEAAAGWLYEDAPFGVLAHDTAADPAFVYANRTAQKCFEYTWDEFVGLPSRLSAAPEARQSRDAFVRSVARDGYAAGYRGVRIAKSGRRFWIEDVTMWDLVDSEGTRHGQAAVFPSWSDL